ncbi:alpha-2,8-polysialyltransferase family protein [Actinomadura sp. ATCC 31491]|uniref:Alpha-2,8-polysialyltransferase family protein n=1 Tax=Actinomadura luzonensis TaxID=2805427 RepID=A0ABT0FUQ2_9ACTN|nr:alpha-2,8-polysialyltransferase family protein [Actinomadura luzonensis]MCK2216068.1 alpha-2,8-polysialyltransferase family protein [Actinomadura luzonensis]
MKVFYASTLFGAMSLAAAIDDGRFGDGRRVLVVSNNAAIPEVAAPLDETPGFAVLRSRFDAVHSWNELIAPLHPSDWRARVIEVPMMERLIRSHLGLDGVEELVLESIAVPPARTIAGLVRDCPITVYSDGLMSYGPTRDPLPAEIHRRVTRLLHLDLVPGLTPLLLSEYGVPPEVLPGERFLAVVAEVTATAPDMLAGQAVILGQYLSALELLSAEEEAELHEAMLRALAARGHGHVVFKPHPAAGRRHAQLMRAAAERIGVRLSVAGESVPAEVCFAALRPELVVGCFSTGLVTARRYFGLPVASFGTDLVLERLAPYENSNRVPVTIVDALLPRLSADGRIEEPPPVELEALVRAVGYCMQAEAYPELRPAEIAFDARYFKRKRLETLGFLARPTALSRLKKKIRAAI